MIRGSITNPTEDEILKGKLPGNVNYGIQGPPGPKGSEGGYYIPDVTQMDENTIQFTFEPSNPDMPPVQPVTITIPVSGDSGGNVDFKVDHTLKLEDGILSVNTTDQMEQDNTLPITSAGVYAIVGNIEALLKTI